MVAITVLGASLRLHDLLAQPLWFDEVNTFVRADAPTPLGVLRHEAHDNQAPLYDLFVWGLMQGFGDDELVARVPPVVFGTALVPATWWLARMTLGGVAGPLVAALLVAVAPVLVAYGQEGRPYAPLALLTALALAAATRIVRSRGERGTLLLGVTAPMLVLLHHYGVLVIAAIVVHLVWCLGSIRERLGRVAAALVPALLLLLLWTPVALYQFKTLTFPRVYGRLSPKRALLALDSWTLEGAHAYHADLARCTFVAIALAALGGLLLLRPWRWLERPWRHAPAACAARPASTLVEAGDRRWQRGVVAALVLASGAAAALAASWNALPMEAALDEFLGPRRGIRPVEQVYLAQLRLLTVAAALGLVVTAALVAAAPAVARRWPALRGANPLVPLAIVVPFTSIVLLDLFGKFTFTTRHSIFVAAPLAVLVAAPIALARKPATAIVAGALLALGSLRAWLEPRPVHVRPDWRAVTRLAAEHADAAIVVYPPPIGRVVEYYTRRPWHSVFATREYDEAVAFAKAHDRVLLITIYDEKHDPRQVAAALAAVRPRTERFDFRKWRGELFSN